MAAVIPVKVPQPSDTEINTVNSTAFSATEFNAKKLNVKTFAEVLNIHNAIETPSLPLLSKATSISTSSAIAAAATNPATVQIKIHRENPHKLILEFFYQPDKQKRTIHYKKILKLTTNNQFDVKRCTKSSGSSLSETAEMEKPISIITPEAILLKLPGIQGEVSLKPDGSFVLGSIDSFGFYLKIKTPYDVIIAPSANLKIAKLLIQCKTFTNNGIVDIEDKLILHTSHRLTNLNKLSALDMKIEGHGRLLNQRLIQARRKLNIYNNALDNNGVILSETLNIKEYPSLLKNSYVNNRGAISGKANLSIQTSHCENFGVIAAQRLLMQVTQKLINTERGQICAEQWLKFRNVNSIENAAIIFCREELLIESSQTFTNFSEGKVSAFIIRIIETSILRNQGHLVAERKLMLQIRWVLENQLSGILYGGEEVALHALHLFRNAGTISTPGKLLLTTMITFENIKSGKIAAGEDLQVLSDRVLFNGGILACTKDILIKSRQWFHNAIGANVQAKGKLNIDVEQRVDNFGLLFAKSEVDFNCLAWVRNGSEGIIAAENVLKGRARSFLNEGVISSETDLKLNTNVILDNINNGKIVAKGTVSLTAALLTQAALIAGKNIAATTEVALQTYAGSRMQAEGLLNLRSNLCIENLGIMAANHIRCDATQIFANQLGGEIFAAQYFEGKSWGILNENHIQSAGDIFLHAVVFTNAWQSNISARKDFSIITREYAINKGEWATNRLYCHAHGILNEGSIKTLQDLLFIMNYVFLQLKNGRLSSENTLQIHAVDAYLAGLLRAPNTLSIAVQRHFDYLPETEWITRLLKLRFDSGYYFSKPLWVPGSLEIQSPKNILVRSEIRAEQVLDIQAQNIAIEKGGLFAGEHLNVKAAGELKIKRHAQLASLGGLHARADVMKNDGLCYAKKEMILEALSRFDNTHHIIGEDNVCIIAPKIWHFRATENDATPIIAAGRNCILQGNTTVCNAGFAIKGKLLPNGNFEFYSEEMEAANRKERKKAGHKGFFKCFIRIYGIAVGIGFSTIIPGGQAIGGAMIKGAVAGGIGAGIGGGNPIKGALQGALLAGVGFQVNQSFGPLLKGVQFSETFRQGLIHAVTAAATTTVNTALNGGSLSKNLLIGIGGATISYSLQTSMQTPFVNERSFDNLLGPSSLVVNIQSSAIDSIVAAALTSVVTHRSLGEGILWSSLSGLMNGFTASAGQQVRHELFDNVHYYNAPTTFLSVEHKQTAETRKIGGQTKRPIKTETRMVSYQNASQQNETNKLEVLWRAANGDTGAREQNRKNWPRLAAFFDGAREGHTEINRSIKSVKVNASQSLHQQMVTADRKLHNEQLSSLAARLYSVQKTLYQGAAVVLEIALPNSSEELAGMLLLGGVARLGNVIVRAAPNVSRTIDASKGLLPIYRASQANVFPSNLRLSNPNSTASISTYNSNNVNAQAALNQKMRALQKAQKIAVRIQEFSDGRIRYYDAERLSNKAGPTRGQSYVTEFNPNTGRVRSWCECYDHQGKVNRIHPKMIDGQTVFGQHYPLTKAELDVIAKLIEGPR